MIKCGGRIVVTEPLVTKIGLAFQVYLMGPNCLVEFFPPKQEIDSGKTISLTDEYNAPIYNQKSHTTATIVCIEEIMKKIYTIPNEGEEIFSFSAALIMINLDQSSIVTAIWFIYNSI